MVENAAGVKEGGKTGLTAVVAGLLFASSLFLAPLFDQVPQCATAPVLILVGTMMTNESKNIGENPSSLRRAPPRDRKLRVRVRPLSRLPLI